MLNNTYKQAIDSTISESTTLRNTKDGWTEKKKGKGCTLFTRKSPDCEIDIVKLEADIPTCIEKVVKFYQTDFESQKKNRDMCDNLEMIERVDENTAVILYRTKSKLVVSPREIIGVQHVKKVSDTEYILTRANLGEHPSVPVSKDIVRADGKIYTIFFTKVNDKLTRITAIMHMDPKGNIPIMLVNSLTEGTVEQFESDITIMAN